MWAPWTKVTLVRRTKELPVNHGGRTGLSVQALGKRRGSPLGSAAYSLPAVAMDRRAHLVGAGAGGPDSGSGQIGNLCQPPVSLSGGAAFSIRPEAMLVRGSRVTGSGGASCPCVYADQSGNKTMIVLPHGTTLSFADLADFRPLPIL